MIICDLSSFYCEKGGGVSTYHRARLDWFARQAEHKYVLISPGPQRRVREIAPTVTTVQVRGIRASRDPDRYRLLTDYEGVRDAIERVAPDVLETHDPWFSLPFGLMLRFHGPYRGLLTTCCHSDPIRTYVTPRIPQWRWLSRPAARFERWSERELYRMHAACHAVLVASESMRTRLTGAGVTNVVKSGFGVDGALLTLERVRRQPWQPVRLLYAGRLDDDKEFELVLAILPELLRRADVQVTIAGAGTHTARVQAIEHPRLRYAGHVASREAMHELYASHDALLAPGRFETFGLSALEGAAAGLLVVGPDQGGTGELLGEWRSPLMFRAGYARAFLDRVCAAIDVDPEALAARGRALAREYGSWSDVVARQVAMYQALLERAPSAKRADVLPRTSVVEANHPAASSPEVGSSMIVEPR